MIALCAYYEGTVTNDAEEFDRYIEEAHMPLVAKYPRLKHLRYLKGAARNGVPPRYYLSIELFFDSYEDFQVAAVSKERDAAVKDAASFEDKFDGVIHHIMYDVIDIDCDRAAHRSVVPS